MPKLKANQRCPIPGHGFICACRDAARKERKLGSNWETLRPGVRRIKDEHADHPDGYRYRLSKAEMDKVLIQKVKEQNGLCSIGGEPLTNMSDVVPDHIKPRGMNGSRRDDRPENIGAACVLHNVLKGSQR